MTPEEDRFLLIGEVVGVHGIRGAVKVRSYAESVSVFNAGCQILLGPSETGQELFTIEWSKPHKNVFLIGFEGMENREQARALVGRGILIEKTLLPELDKGEFYWFDLIGLSVFTVDGKFIGIVDAILRTGSNDVYVVKDQQREILIPALESVVEKIDLKMKLIRVNLPEGL